MTELSINIDTWNKERELSFCPKHFVTTTTPLTDQAKLWVLEKLHGRYYVTEQQRNRFKVTSSLFDIYTAAYISFEDPQEAVFYELTWS